MKVITKAEAKKQGLSRYFTGKPCAKGHIAEKYVNSDKCIQCHADRNKRRERGKAAKSKAVTVIAEPVISEPVHKDWHHYLVEIKAAWQASVEGIIRAGALLVEAKATLAAHGEWLMLCKKLPFSDDTAQRLMAIARHQVISNTEHVRFLPPSWGTLYELTRLPEPVLLAKIEDHTIKADMQRKDVKVIAASVAKEAAEPAERVVTVTYTDPDPTTETIIVPTYAEAEVIEETPPSEERDHLGRTYDEKRWIENHLIRSIHEIDVGGFSDRPLEELAAMIQESDLPLVEKVAVFLTKLAEAMRRKGASSEAAA
jgi:hypothetical protein